VAWSRFDNALAVHEAVGGEQTITRTRVQAPELLTSNRPEYLAARLRAYHTDRPAWSQPLIVYFRRAGDGWSLVGLERNP
jgi:hypothetical protein